MKKLKFSVQNNKLKGFFLTAKLFIIRNRSKMTKFLQKNKW